MKKVFLPLLLTLLLLFSSCAHMLPQIPPLGADTNPDTTVTTTPPESGDTGDGTATAPETDPDTEPDTLAVTAPETEPANSPTETSADQPLPDNPDEDHTDANNDGECDDCGISVVIVLDLFAINDLHGKFCDSDTQGGVDELTTYLKNAYETEDHVILLSSGDMWQGSSESNLTKGFIITEWMNHMDFASMTLGNHEYDWGESFIDDNADLAEFPFLAINVYDRDTNKQASYCKSSVLIRRGGATIGIIGAIGDCYSSISGEMSRDVYFKTGDELTALVKAEAEMLREAGADFIIYSLHDGYGSSSSGSISDSALSAYYDPMLSEGVVDIVFEGHTHQRYALRDSDGVYHIQGGGDNKGISHAEARINFANGQSTVLIAEYIPASRYAHLEGDPIVDTLMDKYKDQVSAGSEVLGHNAAYRSGDDICQLSADLYARVAEEAFPEYDVVLGGGFLKVRSPYNLKAGDVTYSQLQMLLPFDNTLVLCSIKGSDLLNKFINTSNENYFISYTAYGESLKGSINAGDTYYVLVDSYTSTYAPNRLTEVARYTEGIYARDLLAEYIREGGWSGPKPHHVSLQKRSKVTVDGHLTPFLFVNLT